MIRTGDRVTVKRGYGGRSAGIVVGGRSAGIVVPTDRRFLSARQQRAGYILVRVGGGGGGDPPSIRRAHRVRSVVLARNDNRHQLHVRYRSRTAGFTCGPKLGTCLLFKERSLTNARTELNTLVNRSQSDLKMLQQKTKADIKELVENLRRQTIASLTELSQALACWSKDGCLSGTSRSQLLAVSTAIASSAPRLGDLDRALATVDEANRALAESVETIVRPLNDRLHEAASAITSF